MLELLRGIGKQNQHIILALKMETKKDRTKEFFSAKIARTDVKNNNLEEDRRDIIAKW